MRMFAVNGQFYPDGEAKIGVILKENVPQYIKLLNIFITNP